MGLSRYGNSIKGSIESRKRKEIESKKELRILKPQKKNPNFLARNRDREAKVTSGARSKI